MLSLINLVVYSSISYLYILQFYTFWNGKTYECGMHVVICIAENAFEVAGNGMQALSLFGIDSSSHKSKILFFYIVYFLLLLFIVLLLWKRTSCSEPRASCWDLLFNTLYAIVTMKNSTSLKNLNKPLIYFYITNLLYLLFTLQYVKLLKRTFSCISFISSA